MARLEERASQGQVRFNLQLHTKAATAKVNGVSATIAAQDDFGITLAIPAAEGDLVEITYTPVVDAGSLSGGGGGGSDPSSTYPAVATLTNTATSTILIEESGTERRITMDNFLASLGVTMADLSPASTLAGTDIISVSQGGVEKRTTLTAIAAAVAAINGTGGGGGTTATGVTMTGPTTGAVSVASSNFTVGVTPGGGTITGTVVVTPSDNSGGGTFNPTSLSLTTAAPTGTFTYTPSSSAGARTISLTNNGGLTNPSNITYTSSAAATVYTITGFSGNVVKSTLDASTTPNNTQGSLKGYLYTHQATTQYWSISPTPPGAATEQAKCGWGRSNSVPPAEIIDGVGGNTGGSPLNGLSPMAKPAQYNNDNYLWIAPGDNGLWYFWIKPSDGAAQCMNPSGMVVSNA